MPNTEAFQPGQSHSISLNLVTIVRTEHSFGSCSSYSKNQMMMQVKFWGQKAKLKIASFRSGAAWEAFSFLFMSVQFLHLYQFWTLSFLFASSFPVICSYCCRQVSREEGERKAWELNMLKQDIMWNRYVQGIDQRCICLPAAAWQLVVVLLLLLEPFWICNFTEFPVVNFWEGFAFCTISWTGILPSLEDAMSEAQRCCANFILCYSSATNSPKCKHSTWGGSSS